MPQTADFCMPTTDQIAPAIESLVANIQTVDFWQVQLTKAGMRLHPKKKLGSEIVAALSSYPEAGYTEGDIAQLDPRLAGLLHDLSTTASTDDTGAPLIDNALLRATLKLWEDQLVRLESAMFEFDTPRSETLYVYPPLCTLFSRTAARNTFQLCYFTCYQTQTTSSGIPYVSAVESICETFNETWLDENRPEWRNTVLLADSLGLSGIEFARLLVFPTLSEKHPTSADLPDLSFNG